MNIIKLLLLILTIFFTGYSISLFFSDKLASIEGYIIGVIITFIIGIIINNVEHKKYTIFKKYHNIFNFVALLIALLGCVIWFIGEYIVLQGYKSEPIIDATGAFACSISAFISLLLFIQKN